MLLAVYYAWGPVKSWCCKARLPDSMDAMVEARLKRLEVNAQPVSFLFLHRCFISACYFFSSFSLFFLHDVFSAHLREGDDAFHCGVLPGRGGGGGGGVPHRVRLQDPGKLFLPFSQLLLIPHFQASSHSFSRGGGNQVRFDTRYVFLFVFSFLPFLYLFFSGPRSSRVLQRPVLPLRLHLDP